MSEAIAEMVLPGTYIEVRAEGLITVGSIATGNIGIVGTAATGPLATVRPARQRRRGHRPLRAGGQRQRPGRGGPAAADARTRALQQVFAGGAAAVYAVRIAGGTPPRRRGPFRRRTGNAVHADRRRRSARSATTSEYVVVDNGQAISAPLPPDAHLPEPARGVRREQRRPDSHRPRRRRSSSSPRRRPPTRRRPTRHRPPSTTCSPAEPRCPTSTPATSPTGSPCSRTQPVNIVLVAGARRRRRGRPADRPRRAHRERRASERIAILGASSSDADRRTRRRAAVSPTTG